jgi:hypothetical protein
MFLDCVAGGYNSCFSTYGPGPPTVVGLDEFVTRMP